MQPMELDDALAILDRYLKNARDLKLPVQLPLKCLLYKFVQVLGMWGRLQQVKTLVLNGQLKRYAWYMVRVDTVFAQLCVITDSKSP